MKEVDSRQDAPSPEVLRVDQVRRAVERILGQMGGHWRDAGLAAQRLWPIVALGNKCRESGQVDNARATFFAVASTILEDYEAIYDREGDMADVVVDCIHELGKCLDVAHEPHSRRLVLNDLIAIIRWDSLEHGGYGLTHHCSKILRALTNPVERQATAAILRDALAGATFSCRFGPQDVGGLIIELIGPSELDEAALEVLLIQAKMSGQLTDLLLRQQRVADALDLLRDTPDTGAVVDIAERLGTAGYTKEAVVAVSSHVCVLGPRNFRVRDWLQAHGADLPPDLGDLIWDIRRFRGNPTLSSYKKLKVRATRAGWWTRAIAAVGQLDPEAPKIAYVRARVHADCGRVSEALAELDGLNEGVWRAAAVDVALALETQHPGVALKLYLQLLEEAENRGTKPAAKLAVVYRAKVKMLSPT